MRRVGSLWWRKHYCSLSPTPPSGQAPTVQILSATHIGWVELTLVIGNQEHRRRGARARSPLVVVVLLAPVARKVHSWRILGSLARGLPRPVFSPPFF